MKVSVFWSKRTIDAWYIMPSQTLSSRSISRSSEPSGQPGLVTGIGYCVTLPVFGSILPRNIWPKSEYQTLPLLSITTSCGWMWASGRSYSVKMTFVDLPVGRGSVLSGNCQVSCWLKLMVASHSAIGLTLPRSRMRWKLPASRCGRSGVVPGIVGRHPVDDVDQALGVVGRLHDAFERVAADAVEQELLLLLGAGHAVQPLGIGEMRREAAQLGELEVGLGLLARGNLRSRRAGELDSRRRAGASVYLPGSSRAAGNA